METTEQKLQTILMTIEDAPLREDLRNQFYLVNPLEFARQLHALDIADSVKARLLALKVGMKSPHNGVDLSPLIEIAISQMWQRLAGEAKV